MISLFLICRTLYEQLGMLCVISKLKSATKTGLGEGDLCGACPDFLQPSELAHLA